MVKNFLKEEDKKRVEECVRQAKSETSGEIVVRIVPESHHYFESGLRLGMFVFVFVSLGMYVFFRDIPLREAIFIQFLAGILGAFLGSPAPIVRILCRRQLHREVHKAAQSEFVRKGVHLTSTRTGILIYISLLEKRVQILADEGIHQKVNDHFWDKQVGEIIDGISQGKPAEGICRALTEMGAELRKHFPGSKTKNELSNEVALEPLESE